MGTQGRCLNRPGVALESSLLEGGSPGKRELQESRASSSLGLLRGEQA